MTMWGWTRLPLRFWVHFRRWTNPARFDTLGAMQSTACFVALAAFLAPFSLVFGQDTAIPSEPDDPPRWVTYTGTRGPGVGTHIVLISGDEEYRSEEALPQLGKILAVRHGFTCTVLFAINAETGLIDPMNQQNIPGLEALDDADLMIIATRFRDLPDDQMKHIDDYLKSGKPLIGMRTATHAFQLKSSETYAHLSNSAKGGGFGRTYLGEKWIAHHGQHGKQSTRGIMSPMGDGHAITCGIERKSIWGPTDVYAVRLPMLEACQTIVFGMVLDGMSPDSDGIAGPVNQPMMPIAWIQEREEGERAGEGAGEGGGEGMPVRTFTTTMGAATDLVSEGTRRMIVNAVFWALDMEQHIPSSGSDVRIVGTFDPSPFGFGKFVKGKTPQDHALQGDEHKDK